MTRLFLLASLLLVPCAVRPAALTSGSQTCPTSGVKQLSTTNTPAIWISLQAPQGNSGVIAFGGTSTTVAASCAVAVGNCLGSNGTAFLPPVSNAAAYNLASTWIACTASGDSVMFTYLR